MGRVSLLAILLVLALPAVAADVTFGTAVPSRQAHTPQLVCEAVQSQPHTPAQPNRCVARGGVGSVNWLRVRVVGIGHAFTYVDDESSGVPRQLTALHCTTTALQPAKICSVAFSDFFGVTVDKMALTLHTDGPGGFQATAWVERGLYPLP